MQFQLEFRSRLSATSERAWSWIASVKGISEELRPLLRMSAPEGIESLEDPGIAEGRPLFRSRLYLFGVLPIDYSELTLLELRRGVGFIEQSPMGSMRLWRHERTIEQDEEGCAVRDVLIIEPRLFPSLTRWFVQRLFEHRHAVLRRRLGSA